MFGFLETYGHLLAPVEIRRPLIITTVQASLQPNRGDPGPGKGGTTSLENATHRVYLPPLAPVEPADFVISYGGRVYAPVAEPHEWTVGGIRHHWVLGLVGPNPYRDVLQLPVQGGLVTNPKTGNKEPATTSTVPVRVRLIEQGGPIITVTPGMDVYQQEFLILWDPTNATPIESIPWGVTISYNLAGHAGKLVIQQPHPIGSQDKNRVYGLRLRGFWTRNG